MLFGQYRCPLQAVQCYSTPWQDSSWFSVCPDSLRLSLVPETVVFLRTVVLPPRCVQLQTIPQLTLPYSIRCPDVQVPRPFYGPPAFLLSIVGRHRKVPTGGKSMQDRTCSSE